MSIYAHFGYSLNRVSAEQAKNGRSVSLSELQPGDLLFYNYSGSRISHVAMYIGGGQIIHASTEETGIIISGMGSPCCARRIVG
jgi:cell wall-associated NlpC family hydrolase